MTFAAAIILAEKRWEIGLPVALRSSRAPQGHWKDTGSSAITLIRFFATQNYDWEPRFEILLRTARVSMGPEQLFCVCVLLI